MSTHATTAPSPVVQNGSGYAEAGYADSLAEFGRPRALPGCGGWVLERPLPDGLRDAMGPYPRFACDDWTALAADIEALRGELVSVMLVTDPFAPVGYRELETVFPDRMVPFKTHYVTDLTRDLNDVVTRHHRYYARKAGREMRLAAAEPASLLDEWVDLYATLVRRHDIRGMAAFSPESFAALFGVPGLRVVAAWRDETVVGMQLWLRSGEVAYHHLSAYSAAGYTARVSYGLLWTGLRLLQAEGVRMADLGAAAGLRDADDGLTAFKRGWSSDTRTAYLCGRILDPAAYRDLTDRHGAAGSAFFPAYRTGTSGI